MTREQLEITIHRVLREIEDALLAQKAKKLVKAQQKLAKLTVAYAAT